MWSLIILSHILMFVSFLMLSISIFYGHFQESTTGSLILNNFSIYAVIIYVLTQTLILFLVIAINKQIKQLILDQSFSLDATSYSKSKSKMYIHTYSNVLFIGTLAILFAAVHTELISQTIHSLFFILSIIHYGYTILLQYDIFKEISKLIVRINSLSS
tara:strand:- start:383 stop:859 length:477 start_codon:yes stop_codon:yes gene_type:complete